MDTDSFYIGRSGDFLYENSIQLGLTGQFGLKEIGPAKTVETHSFLLLKNKKNSTKFI